MTTWSTSFFARAVRRFRAYDAEQRRVAMVSLAALPVLQSALRLGGLRAVRWLVRGRAHPTAPPAGDPVADGRHLAEPVRAAARLWHLDRRGCVARSALLWRLLTRRGIPAQARIGTRLSGQPGPRRTLAAHAWVEVDGVPVDDGRDVVTRYAALDGRPLFGRD